MLLISALQAQAHTSIDLLVCAAIVLLQGAQYAAAARRHTSGTGRRGACVSA